MKDPERRSAGSFPKWLQSQELGLRSLLPDFRSQRLEPSSADFPVPKQGGGWKAEPGPEPVPGWGIGVAVEHRSKETLYWPMNLHLYAPVKGLSLENVCSWAQVKLEG